MKTFFFLLIFPAFTMAQTVHTDDGKIVYKGKEKINASPVLLIKKAQDLLPGYISKFETLTVSDDVVSGRGEFKLQSPKNIVRKANFSIKIQTTTNGYEYLIDSVSIQEKERGGSTVNIPSEKLLENMGEAGKIVSDTERVLNDLDMQFQKILAVLRSGLKNSSL